jgi:hypothetical protein
MLESTEFQPYRLPKPFRSATRQRIEDPSADRCEKPTESDAAGDSFNPGESRVDRPDREEPNPTMRDWNGGRYQLKPSARDERGGQRSSKRPCGWLEGDMAQSV